MSVVGSRVGRIRIESLLGKGGMGEVYVGLDETLQRQVALKSIRAEHRLSAEAKARFVREAQTLSRLDHPNICKIHDLIEGEDRDYLVLELIRGRDLKVAIGQGLDPSKRLRIARQVAEALVAAHAEGVVHRDLKPENVMLTESGDIKVLDFGLARPGFESSSTGSPALVSSPGGRVPDPSVDLAGGGESDRTLEAAPGDLTMSLAVAPASGTAGSEPQTVLGTILGTLTYMSPEQARGEQVTTASDMYSFGLLLQALFTSREPYPPGADRKEVYRRALAAETLPATGIDADLTRLIERLKSPPPAARPNAVEAAARLRWIADRPKRRAKWLVAAGVMAILALGGLKYTLDLRHERTIAVEARDEADLRRGQAEDLIGFMLGDLREKLEPVGRLDVLDDVGDKALDYFASLPQEDLTNEELHRRSRALNQIGEVRIAQGDLDAAMRSFDESLVLASGLVGRDPSNAEWLAGLGTVHFWIGNVHWLRGDLESASSEFRSYLGSSQRLVALQPENEDWQLEVAYGHTNLGAVYQALGNSLMALAEIRRSIEIKERLARLDPGDAERRRSLANGFSWLASTLEESGDLSGALEQYQAELELRTLLAASDPRDAGAQELLAICHGHLGDLHIMTGSQSLAEPQFAAYRELTEDLVARDPENAQWKREYAVSLNRLGRAHLQSGDLSRARKPVQRSREILETLLRRDPSNADWQLQLGIVVYTEALARHLENRLSEAEATAREAVALLEPLAREKPDLWRAHRYISLSHSLLGQVAARRGREPEAAGAWQGALDVIEPTARGASNVLVLEAWARALLHLGRLEEAAPVIASLASHGYAAPDFVSLSRQKGVWPGPGTSAGGAEAG